MLIPNQRYRFVPPDGDPADPIWIFGLQHDSPGQTQKVDVWRFEVPPAYRNAIPDGAEFTSYESVYRTVAMVYFDGDTAKARDAIQL
jgi:hypothetical protein